MAATHAEDAGVDGVDGAAAVGVASGARSGAWERVSARVWVLG